MPFLPSSARFALVLLGSILLAYWQALWISFLSDDFVLLSAAQLQSLPEIFAIDPAWFFYRPFGALAWWLQYRLFGLSGALYHAFSLGLHWLNSLLVVGLARRFLPQPHAFGAGVLFALLPLHSETVAWLAAQYDLLATCAYLTALLCLLRWADVGDTEYATRARFWFLAALVAFQLSLWSKEIAFTFPLAAVIVLLLARRRLPLCRLVVGLLPFCALLGLNLVQRYLAWGRIGGYAGAGLLPADGPHVLGRTVFTLLSPLNQLVFPPWLVWGWAAVVGLLLLAGLVRSPFRRAMLVGLLWLAVTLTPALGLLPVGADMQNARVFYMPSIGFCLLLAACVGRAANREVRTSISSPQSPVSRPSKWTITLLALAGLLALQFQLGPWVLAGQNARQVVQEFHRLAPLFPPDSRVSAVGLPDNVQGAYVYRLGLNHSYAHFFQQTFALEPLPALAPFRFDLRGTEAQVQFGFDDAAQGWGVGALRSVGADRLLPPDEQRWDITACPEEWRSAACTVGQGARGWLESPVLDQIHTGWYELMVLADVPASGEQATLVLLWRGAADATWVSSQAASFNLPSAGGTYAYRLALNPAEGGLPIEQVRVQIGRGSVRAVALRAVR